MTDLSKPVYIIEQDKIKKLSIIIAKAICIQNEKAWGFKCIANSTKKELCFEETVGSIDILMPQILNDLGIKE